MTLKDDLASLIGEDAAEFLATKLSDEEIEKLYDMVDTSFAQNCDEVDELTTDDELEGTVESVGVI